MAGLEAARMLGRFTFNPIYVIGNKLVLYNTHNWFQFLHLTKEYLPRRPARGILRTCLSVLRNRLEALHCRKLYTANLSNNAHDASVRSMMTPTAPTRLLNSRFAPPSESLSICQLHLLLHRLFPFLLYPRTTLGYLARSRACTML